MSNYLTTDYSNHQNTIAKVVNELEQQRNQIVKLKQDGHNTGELNQAIIYLEQSLLNLDHYLQRRTNHGIYTLDVPENTLKFEEALRSCYNQRATDTRIVLVIDEPTGPSYIGFTLKLGEMATVGELHYFVYRYLLGLKQNDTILNVVPYQVDNNTESHEVKLTYFINAGKEINGSTLHLLTDIKDEIIHNSDYYYQVAVEHSPNVESGDIIFLLRDYTKSGYGISAFNNYKVGLGDIVKELTANNEKSIDTYSSIMLGIERLFKDNGVVVFGLSRLPGVLISFSQTDPSIIDKVKALIAQYQN